MSKELEKMNLQTDEEISAVVQKAVDKMNEKAEKIKKQIGTELVSTEKYVPDEYDKKWAEWGRTPPQSKPSNGNMEYLERLKKGMEKIRQEAPAVETALQKIQQTQSVITTTPTLEKTFGGINQKVSATSSLLSKVNVLSLSNSSGSGGNEASMFEEVEIPTETIAFADKLREMFEKIKEAAQPTITAINDLKESLDPLNRTCVLDMVVSNCEAWEKRGKKHLESVI